MVTMVTLIIMVLNSSYLYIAQIFKYVMWSAVNYAKFLIPIIMVNALRSCDELMKLHVAMLRARSQ